MSEVRMDPTTEEWVIIAKERAKRPSDFVYQREKPRLPDLSASCPFCPGNEQMTPPATLSYFDQSRQQWQVRAFANRFPALSLEGTATRREEEGFFLSMDGLGVHEVIVETPVHNTSLALMGDKEVERVLRAYHERYNALSRLSFVHSVITFRNHGRSAGTSLEHPHSQIIAASVVPKHVRRRYEVAIRYYDKTDRCLYSDLLDHELRIGKRLIMETERFAVFHPFASHRPFETWIMPKVHQAYFGNASAEDLRNLAHVLRMTLLKLYRALNNPDFNYVIETIPLEDQNKRYYLWHLRLIPRLTEVAGFEIGSGIYINTAIPEETAQFMRELKIT
jgi:UDPglucose--hexose-1-phosphate uridylyltransferase